MTILVTRAGRLSSVTSERLVMAFGLGASAIATLATVGCTRSTQAGKNPPTSIFEAIAPPTPAEAAAWATDEYDADKRYRGTLLLANAPFGGEPVYVEMYTKAAEDTDPVVRGAAIRGLALHGSPSHVPIILAQIEDEDRLLRWECVRALQRLHNPAAIPALIKRTNEREEADSMVRAAAADALGQYADSRVLDGLIAALGDRDLSVNDAALRSLRTLTGQDLGDDLRAWYAWTKSTRTPFAAKRPYIYPVFQREKNFVEIILPIFTPPNEIASTPAGIDVAPVGSVTPAAAESSQPGEPSSR